MSKRKLLGVVLAGFMVVCASETSQIPASLLSASTQPEILVESVDEQPESSYKPDSVGEVSRWIIIAVLTATGIEALRRGGGS